MDDKDLIVFDTLQQNCPEKIRDTTITHNCCQQKLATAADSDIITDTETVNSVPVWLTEDVKYCEILFD
jgi:hypothetical protein